MSCSIKGCSFGSSKHKIKQSMHCGCIDICNCGSSLKLLKRQSKKRSSKQKLLKRQSKRLSKKLSKRLSKKLSKRLKKLGNKLKRIPKKRTRKNNFGFPVLRNDQIIEMINSGKVYNNTICS